MPGEAATKLTLAEYLAREATRRDRHELFRGELFAMAGGSFRHNFLCARAITLLGSALGDKCVVMTSDQRIGIVERDHYVYADAAVVCGPVRSVPGTTDVLENPGVVVEVLSRSTEQYDRGEKWLSYRRIPSLTDYVLVAQSEARVEHFRREADGSWRVRIAERGDRIELATGATLTVDDLFTGAFDLAGD